MTGNIESKITGGMRTVAIPTGATRFSTTATITHAHSTSTLINTGGAWVISNDTSEAAPSAREFAEPVYHCGPCKVVVKKKGQLCKKCMKFRNRQQC